MPATADPAKASAESDAKPKPFRAHLDGCPARADRIESFEVTRPRDQAIMVTTRCRDCGGQTTKATGQFARTEEPKEQDDDE